MIKSITLSLLTLGLSLGSFAQSQKCASHVIHNKKMSEDVAYQTRRMAIESQVASAPSSARKTATVYTIPMVVHVIHNGETEGSGTNISDAQIQSAVIALNKDFRMENSDSLTPSHPFYNLSADVELEFCLAKKDPSGQATTGITRTNRGQADWEANLFDSIVKPATIWDHTKYLNVWVVTIGGVDAGTLGYASFPGAPDTTDGVVIGTTFFGTTGNVSQGFDLNRTFTHEVGHYLNLYHIWGDETCGDDEVADTPTAQQDNSGCPSFPHNVSSACSPGSNGEMYMNYMDYTDDACMNLFTLGQKTRMRAAIEGPRVSLTTSDACNNPTSAAAISASAAKVFPNPTTELVTVNSGTDAVVNLAIYDLSGAQVFAGVTTGANTVVNVTAFQAGNYIVVLSSEAGIVQKSLTVIK